MKCVTNSTIWPTINKNDVIGLNIMEWKGGIAVSEGRLFAASGTVSILMVACKKRPKWTHKHTNNSTAQKPNWNLKHKCKMVWEMKWMSKWSENEIDPILMLPFLFYKSKKSYLVGLLSLHRCRLCLWICGGVLSSLCCLFVVVAATAIAKHQNELRKEFLFCIRNDITFTWTFKK